MNPILLVYISLLSAAVLTIVLMRTKIQSLNGRIVGIRKENDARVGVVKEKALAEIRQQVEMRRSSQETMTEIRNAERLEWNAERQLLIGQITELAARPPIMIPPAAGPDIAALIRQVGESVAHVAYGPIQQQTPMTEEEIRTTTLNLVGDMNGTLGGREGEWMPDVEMDEWMEANGMPNRPGAVAGTGPPQIATTPDSYMDTADGDLPPGVVGLASSDRANSDGRVFRSGVGAQPPTGGIED